MRIFILALATALAIPASAQQPPILTADAIMSRVAANQDAADAARAHFVYTQHAKTTSRKGKTVRCEEITDTRITPTATGSGQTLLKLDGRVLYKGKYIPYTTLEGPAGIEKEADDDASVVADMKKIDDDTETDRDLVQNIRKNMLDSKSKDGIDANLFPLTSANQKDMVFTLVKEEPMNGRQTFHITFHPKANDDFGWKGDAWIDTTAFQPVVIRTAMSKRVPLAIRALLGTDVPGLGFTATYEPQPKAAPGATADPNAIWFPATFGTEFKIRVFYFFSREIALSVSNRDFERTHTSSTIRSIGDPNHLE